MAGRDLNLLHHHAGLSFKKKKKSNLYLTNILLENFKMFCKCFPPTTKSYYKGEWLDLYKYFSFFRPSESKAFSATYWDGKCQDGL